VLVEGQSLLTLAMRALFAPEVPPGHELALHPVAAAAWLGLLVTMLNLLPIGQLDGGHVTYALWGERARKVGRAAVALLVPLGIFAWAGWLLWALVGWRLVRTAHPPVASDAPLGPRRRLVARASLALFALTFMPLPVDVR
jgi:membrane-associated protease RseP (regulator of RpoE activity)